MRQRAHTCAKRARIRTRSRTCVRFRKQKEKAARRPPVDKASRVTRHRMRGHTPPRLFSLSLSFYPKMTPCLLFLTNASRLHGCQTRQHLVRSNYRSEERKKRGGGGKEREVGIAAAKFSLLQLCGTTARLEVDGERDGGKLYLSRAM